MSRAVTLSERINAFSLLSSWDDTPGSQYGRADEYLVRKPLLASCFAGPPDPPCAIPAVLLSTSKAVTCSELALNGEACVPGVS